MSPISSTLQRAPLLYGAPGALLTAAVLIAGVVLTAMGWRAAMEAERQAVRNDLATYATRVEQAIEARMARYEGLLRAAAGVIEAFWPVSPQEWREFALPLRLRTVYPGVQGLGFSLIVREPEDVTRWRREWRAFDAQAGIPELGSSEAPPPESLIVLLEPLDRRNRRAIGFDMMSEVTRRAAMERARDGGEAALSGRVVLVQEFDSDPQPGFLLYLPVYQDGATPEHIDERRRRLLGFSYSPFRAIDFFGSTLEASSTEAIVEVYDGRAVDPDALLYRSAAQPREERLSEVRALSVGGREWTLRLWSGSAPPPSRSAQVIAVSGGVITALMGAIVAMLALSRQRLRERIEVDRAIAQHERRLAEQLEERVVERTRQLEQANRELTAANHDLEAFTYTVSHDLRAPLRAIDGHVARLLEAGEANEAQRRHGAAVRRNVGRMTQLIEDLLNLAMVSRQPLERRRVALWSVAAPVVEELSAAHRFELEADPQRLGEVYADPAMLRQALVNLLGNAVKFSSRNDAPRVSIGVDERDGERVWYVRDNGVGFDMRYAGKLFGVFERLHGASEFDGLGVGLAIVKQIIERHGGRVWAHAEPERGAAFYFTLGDG